MIPYNIKQIYIFCGLLFCVITFSACGMPQSFEDLSTKAMKNLHNGHYEEAIANADTGLEIKKDHPGMLTIKGLALYSQGKYVSALENVTNAIMHHVQISDPSFLGVLFQARAKIYYKLEDYEATESDLVSAENEAREHNDAGALAVIKGMRAEMDLEELLSMDRQLKRIRNGL